jgi:hypothetical protein
MGFNKKYISKETIKRVANHNDYKLFFEYFIKSDAIISDDDFSMKVLNRIKKCTINDKDEIINIMNECK